MPDRIAVALWRVILRPSNPDTRENALLSRIPASQRARFISIAESVNLQLGEVLCVPGERTPYVYFPVDGFISLVTTTDRDPALEVGMVGREGMLGAQLLVGVEEAPIKGLVQGNGTAWRMEAGRFRHELGLSKALHGVLGQYIYVLMRQLTISAACTRFHAVGPRLARWLAMSEDRAEADSFQFTHEFLAYMLGVRRVGISTAASVLKRHGLIEYRRGAITVLDHGGLRAAACGCYGADIRAYEAMYGSATQLSVPAH